MSSSLQPHPYGVLPTGNSFFALSNQLIVRANGLGVNFKILTDELITEIISFLNGKSVCNLSLTSRYLYVCSHHSDIWRDLVIRECGVNGINFVNTWKDTFMTALAINNNQNSSEKIVLKHQPIKVEGIYSDFLHRSWSCRQYDYEISCPGILSNDDIPHIPATELSVQQFINNYEMRNLPVVITGAVNDWPALNKWKNIDYLINELGDAQLRATSAAAPLPATFTVKQYFQYAQQIIEEAPLYLFERHFSHYAPQLELDYSIPKYFRPGPIEDIEQNNNNNNLCHNRTDLFNVFGAQHRPDYRWLIAGPARSGSIFHIDPNQTNAWNVCIKGRKKWIFYPPHVNPPGVKSSPDGADVAVPISTGEWLLSFWKYHKLARLNLNIHDRPLETIVNEGELIFVPHNYWHMVVNIDEESIALTHNYVSHSNLNDVLRFLREKPDQISGVRDRISEGVVQPDVFYDIFVDKLRGSFDQKKQTKKKE
eukprot:gene16155-21960_t